MRGKRKKEREPSGGVGGGGQGRGVRVKELVLQEIVGAGVGRRADGRGGGGHGLGIIGDELAGVALLHVGGEVLVELGGDEFPDLGRAALVHPHAPEDLNVIVDLKAGVELKVVLGPRKNGGSG